MLMLYWSLVSENLMKYLTYHQVLSISFKKKLLNKSEYTEICFSFLWILSRVQGCKLYHPNTAVYSVARQISQSYRRCRFVFFQGISRSSILGFEFRAIFLLDWLPPNLNRPVCLSFRSITERQRDWTYAFSEDIRANEI